MRAKQGQNLLGIFRQCVMGLGVDDAQGAQAEVIGRDQRRASIKAGVGCDGDQGIFGEQRILRGVVDHINIVAFDGMGAEGPLARRLGGADAIARLEPLPVAVDERDQRDWHADQLGGDLGDLVEIPLGRGIENLVLGQFAEAAGFGVRRGGGVHSPPLG